MPKRKNAFKSLEKSGLFLYSFCIISLFHQETHPLPPLGAPPTTPGGGLRPPAPLGLRPHPPAGRSPPSLYKKSLFYVSSVFTLSPCPPSPKGEGGIVVFRRGALRAPLHSLLGGRAPKPQAGDCVPCAPWGCAHKHSTGDCVPLQPPWGCAITPGGGLRPPAPLGLRHNPQRGTASPLHPWSCTHKPSTGDCVPCTLGAAPPPPQRGTVSPAPPLGLRPHTSKCGYIWRTLLQPRKLFGKRG